MDDKTRKANKKEKGEKIEIKIKEDVKKETVKKDDKKKKDETTKLEKEKQKHLEKIKELEKKVEELNDKYLYALAEMKDLHKIYEKENKTAIKYVKYDFMYELLQIYDVFAIVLESKKVPEELVAYFRGFEMLFEKLKQFFKANKVSEIVTNVGDKFDYNKHNAVEKETTTNKELDETVEKVLLKGYMFEDRILRPVAVKVYKYEEEKEKKDEVIEESNKKGE